MSPGFRKLEPKDLDQVLEWERSCFPEDPWDRKMLLSHLEFHEGFSWEDKAYCLVCETPWEVEIFRIATLPEYRKQKFAKHLLFEIINLFPNKDFFLEVKESNIAALQLYLSLQFLEMERRRKYYSNGEDAVLMKRTVKV